MKADGESDSPLVDYEQRSVGTTWMISFQMIEKRNPNAANLVRLWAFVDNKDVWHGLLQGVVNNREEWPGWLYHKACDETKFLEATSLLLRYSMIEARESTQGNYGMHPVVHQWALHMQDGIGKRNFLRLAMTAVGFSVRVGDIRRSWEVERRLLPHADMCSWRMREMHGGTQGFDDRFALFATNNLGNLYLEHGRLDEAEAMYNRALEGRKEVFGLEHITTLNAVYRLGHLFIKQDRLDEAQAMFDRVLHRCQAALSSSYRKSQAVMRDIVSLIQYRKGMSDAGYQLVISAESYRPDY